jgi:hypothetical protein
MTFQVLNVRGVGDLEQVRSIEPAAFCIVLACKQTVIMFMSFHRMRRRRPGHSVAVRQSVAHQPYLPASLPCGEHYDDILVLMTALPRLVIVPF